MALRDNNFGLNFNQGFGSGPMTLFNTYDPRERDAFQGYNDQVLGRQRFQQQRQLQGDELAQREREFQRNYDLQNRELQQRMQIAQLQMQASLAPLQWEKQKYGQTAPGIRSQIADLGRWQSAGGVGGQQPFISDAPVYSEQQIQNQVNSQRAQNDAQTASQTRQMQQQMAGRGFGSRSPLAMALGQGYQNQALAANTQAENDLRFQAAQANSQQVLRAQQAREQQYASRQGEDIERRKTGTGGISALLTSLL